MVKKLTSSKAKKILRDGQVHGKPLTSKQKRYFGHVAGDGKAQSGGWLDKYQDGGEIEYKDGGKIKYPDGGEVDAISGAAPKYWQIPIKEREDFKGNWLSKMAERVASGDRNKRGIKETALLADSPYSRSAAPNREKDYKELYDLYRYYFGQPLQHNVIAKSKYHPSNAKENLDNYIAIKDTNFINQVLDIAKREDLQLNETKSTSGYAKYDMPNNTTRFGMNAPSDSLVGKPYVHVRPNGKKIEGVYGQTTEYYDKKFNENYATNAIGNFRIGRGQDEGGEYISYYDLFDRATGKDKNNTLGAAKPFEIYDRIYVDKDSTGRYIPREEFKNGGQLKKSNQLRTFTNGWLDKYM